MTLPASPPISLAQVRAEFGAPAGTPLHAFVRGGAWVPNTTTNASVPTAVPITLHQLCGASKITALAASLSPASVSGTGSSSVAIAVGSNACHVTATGGTGSYTYAWQRVSGTAMVLSAATGATTTFAHAVNPNTTVSAVYRCAVSSGGTTVYTGNVSVSLRNEGGA